MTAPEKVMQKLVHMVTGTRYDNPAAIREAYQRVMEDDLWDALCDARGELRYGTEKTGLPCGYSRHYECHAVAAQMLDGSWVGWDCWTGGGKHDEPETIEWVDDAYDVTATEVVKVVKEFAVAEKGGGH